MIRNERFLLCYFYIFEAYSHLIQLLSLLFPENDIREDSLNMLQVSFQMLQKVVILRHANGLYVLFLGIVWYRLIEFLYINNGTRVVCQVKILLYGRTTMGWGNLSAPGLQQRSCLKKGIKKELTRLSLCLNRVRVYS